MIPANDLNGRCMPALALRLLDLPGLIVCMDLFGSRLFCKTVLLLQNCQNPFPNNRHNTLSTRHWKNTDVPNIRKRSSHSDPFFKKALSSKRQRPQKESETEQANRRSKAKDKLRKMKSRLHKAKRSAEATSQNKNETLQHRSSGQTSAECTRDLTRTERQSKANEKLRRMKSRLQRA